MRAGPHHGTRDGGVVLAARESRRLLWKRIWYYRWIYLLMVLPTLALTIVFRYLTLPGIFLSFMSFKPIFRPAYVYQGPAVFKGLAEFLHVLNPANLFAYFGTSRWVGLDHFARLFSESNFRAALVNTIVIALIKLLIAFPFPILLAILLNEVRLRSFKRSLQTILTFPHFLSWVVLAGIILNLLGDTGAVKKIFLYAVPAVAQHWNVLYNPKFFRVFLVLTDMWKEAGWSSILYLAAIAGIDPALYEAATIDGCDRIRKILHITVPSIMSFILIMFLLNVGNLVNANFDQVFNLYSPQTYSTGDVIDTYIYRQSFQSDTVNDFGFTTAVGLFKSVVNFALLLGANSLARRFGSQGIL